MNQLTDFGFKGIFYAAADQEKAMIVVTGSDGGIKWAKQIAAAFAQHGVPALAVAYWKTRDTSKTLSLIPIETIQAAVVWLKDNGYSKVGIYGVSKGAELALTAASLLPQIELVIAVSPSCCVFEGIAQKKYSGASSWTWQGKPLPYVSFDGMRVNVLKNVLKNHEFGFLEQYQQVLTAKMNEKNIIKVERINGAILLISAKNDAQWPSADMGNRIIDRLNEKAFIQPFCHKILDPASHILCPVNTMIRFAYRAERNHPQACQNARDAAWKLALAWTARL
jgi:dienelactone hydrolase